MSQSFVHVHLVALKYFAETVRCGSMRQAADALSVAPSAVNRQILKLEDQLQVRLFDRVADGVKMNAAGEVLYHYIRSMERNLETAIDHIYEMRGISRGNIRIASEDGIARDFLAAELAKFSARYPRITFSLQVQPASKVLEALIAADVDIALSMTPPQRHEMKIEARAELPLGVAMSPSHPLAGRQSLTLSELSSEPMVLGNSDYGGTASVNHQLSEGGRHRPLMECNSTDLAVTMVRHGLGCTIRSPVGILDELKAGNLRFVPLSDKANSKVAMCLWSHPTSRPLHAAAVLLQQLTAALPAFSQSMDPWRDALPKTQHDAAD